MIHCATRPIIKYILIKMKISVVSRHHNQQTRQLQIEAKELGVEFELVNVDSLTRIGERINSLGEVVIWRTASLDVGVGRAAFLTRLARKRVVINSALASQPFVAHKLYQQKLVEPLKTILSIPTYYFKSRKRLMIAVENGVLKYPFIMKADLGARGEKVYLIKEGKDIKDDVSIKDFVFQNYVINKGDYRVLVLGGVALGVMKRMAKEGEFRNNISLGGEAVDASKLPEAAGLIDKAVTIASLFGLHFCGVDFIKDEESGEFRFLEVNTVAQWQGFSQATGINVAEKLIQYCVQMGKRQSGKKEELCKNYISIFEDYLPVEKRLHFWSRLYLWTGDESYLKCLESIKEDVCGNNAEQIRKRILQLIEEADEDRRRMMSKKATLRRKYYLDNSELGKANNLLFFWLMAKIIYGVEIRDYIKDVLSDEKITALVLKLSGDEKAVRYLSTAAVNFLYLSAEYLDLPKPDSKELVRILVGETKFEKEHLRTAIYLLTHIVICESLFYFRPVDGEKLREVVICAEKLIKSNYFTVSLDMKFEFLVCCQMTNHMSGLRKIILTEAEWSLSPLGNFLVDTHNDWKNRHSHKLAQAEHRNTLYLMACSKINHGI